jgi:hypothetical protein
MKPATLLFLCVLGCSLPVAYPQTVSEIPNKQGLANNPAGLKLLLRTKDGRSTFHLFETIPIEWEFSSSRPTTYSIELDEAMNFAGQANWFDVFPRDAVFVPYSAMGHRGVVCCESDKRYLSSRPTILERELTDYLRFEKPGTYSVHLVTWRVFRGASKSNDFLASRLGLASNILTLTILPDDPEWDSQRLAEVLRTLSDPHVRANYAAALDPANRIEGETARDLAMDNLVNQTEFIHAQQALNALDTEAAIRERVRLMNMESKSQLQQSREFGGRFDLSQPLLESTTRADLFVGAMKERAGRPDFGVDYDYVQWWAEFLVQRDHPELFRAVANQAEREKALGTYEAYNDQARRELVTNLKALLPGKTPEAAQITGLTVQLMKFPASPQH